MATDTLQVTVHEGSGGHLPELRAEWEECLRRAPPEQALFTFDWYDAWMATYGSRPPWTGESRVLTVHDDSGRAVAILPLAVRRQRGLRLLSLAGLYQPFRAFPCVTGTALSACRGLVDKLFDTRVDWDGLRIGPFDRGAAERAALFDAIEARAPHVLVSHLGRTILNELLPTLDDYRKMKLGKRCEYYERRWRKEQPARIEFFDGPTDDALRRMLDDLAAVENKSWLRGADGDFRFVHAVDRAFWESVGAGLAERGQLQVWIAYHDRIPVAFRFTLTSGTAAYLLANQYDRAYARYSLGWVLYMHHLAYAFERGIRTIDLAPHDFHYKGRLGGRETEMRMELLAFPATRRGRLLFCALRSVGVLRRILEKSAIGRRLAAPLPRVSRSVSLHG